MFEEKYYKLLACPYCKLELKRNKKGLSCVKCKRRFSIRKGVPIIIPDDFNVSTWKKGKRGLETNSFFKKFFAKKKKPFLNVENKLTLDVGCGEDAEGMINMDVYFPKQMPKNFLIGSAEYLPFVDDSIDIVKSSYVIEHLLSPSNFILDCIRIAREEVIIILDNSDWIGEILMRLIGVGRIFHDEHYYKWSEEYMRNLIKRVGVSGEVEVLNLSTNPLVIALSLLGNISRIGKLFYRDLFVEIRKKEKKEGNI